MPNTNSNSSELILKDVFKEMWPFVFTSIIVIVILIFSFYYIMANNLKQKKLLNLEIFLKLI